MRDDVRALATELALHFGKKLDLLRKLLLSETDKLHYERSGNIDRVMELTREDGATIESINLVDYDIAHAEDGLSRIIGVGRSALYGSLGTGPEAGELAVLRERMRHDMEELFVMRKELSAKLESDARSVKESILALSRIDSLKLPGPEGNGR